MKQAAAGFLAKYLLTTFALLAFYAAFLMHDALYPGSGNHLKSFAVVLLAYLGFTALHKALHVQDPKDSNSLDDME